MHNLKLVHCIKESIVAFVVCTIAGKQAEHGFDAEATLQTACGAAVGIGRDFGIVLAIGGKTHDIIPVIIP